MDIKDRLKNLTPEQRANLLKKLSEDKSEQKQTKSLLPEIVHNPDERYKPFLLNNLQQAYLIGRSNAFELGNIPSAAYVEIECNKLDYERFQNAWLKLINRHEILRSIVNQNYTQSILKTTPEFKIQINDLKHLNPAEVQNQLQSVKKRLLHTIKNSEEWPMFEVEISQIKDGIDHIHFKLDLLNFDAGSIAILFNELKEFYLDPEKEFPSLTLSFRDYLIAEKKFEDTEFYKRSKKYWTDRLTTIPPVPALPLIKSPKDIEKPYFVRRISKLNATKWNKLKSRFAKEGLTPTILLLTAYAEILGLWSSTLKFSINIPLFNRFPLHPDANKIIGDFSTVEILEVDRTKKKSFLDRAKEIHKQLISDLDNRYYDGVAVFRDLAKINSDDFRKGVPVVFTSLLDHSFTESISRIGKIVDSVNQTAFVWCDLHVDEVEGELVIKFDAVEELFEQSVLDDMLSSYTILLEKLADDENNFSKKDLDIYPPQQLQRRKENNDTAKTVPNELLHTLFSNKAKEQPEKLAVISSSKSLTFKELNILSNKIGNKLRKEGAEPDKLVAIIMEKGWEQIPAVYGILKAGSAYLPIDPNYPNERITELLVNGEAQIVLTQSWLKEQLELPDEIKCYCIDNEDFSSSEATDLESVQKPNNLAYVLYTSGSTGVPKGVMIEHRSVVNRMLDVNNRYKIKNTDRAIALTALQHDLSVYDVFGMLIAGGSIVIPDNDKRLDPAHWTEIMSNEKVTFWNSVPAFMEMYIDYLENRNDKSLIPDSFNKVVLSGDWIPVSLPDRLRGLKSDIQIIASGGPTETTIWDIYYYIDKIDTSWKSIPYGQPLTNASYYIMKENLEECPDYVIGEMCIGGVGLARGFWKDDEKTKEKFVTHPVTGERLYKSGDLGYFRSDGLIQIAGRKDFQVKIRGLRVELGEIESIIEKHSEIKDALVIAAGDSQTNKRLIGYIVPSIEFEEPPVEIKNKIAEDSSETGIRDGSLMSDIEKMELKLKHLELRQNDDSKPQISLVKPDANLKLKEKYLARQTYRTFQNGSSKISIKQFGNFLECLAQYNSDELPFPKYRYPSAGSIYPVQVYLYIKPDKIEDVEGGTYYYHPKEHRLVQLSKNPLINRTIHTVNNYQTFEDSAFSVFLVAQMKAIAPLYGTKTISSRIGKSRIKTLISGLQSLMFLLKQKQSAADASRDFCLLEAGYMGQLLMSSSQENQIGLCPVGGVDFEKIRQYFDLEDSHSYIHGFVGGPISPVQTKMFSLISNMSIGSSATDPKKVFVDELKIFLQDRLPDYMIPTNFVIMDKLPLTAYGKIDRKALPSPDTSTLSSSETYTPPRNKIEEQLTQIWQKILQVKTISVYDNFFDLGGHSLLIIQMFNQISNEFKIELSIATIFESPTINQLASKITEQVDVKS